MTRGNRWLDERLVVIVGVLIKGPGEQAQVRIR
jgi:hypothetical protein